MAYNGWTNYETWSVALLIDNEQGSSDYWRERATETYRDASPRYSFETRTSAAYSTLADELREWHDENNPLADDCTIFGQLLSGALSDVDWREVARHYIDDVAADVDAEEEDEEDACKAFVSDPDLPMPEWCDDCGRHRSDHEETES